MKIATLDGRSALLVDTHWVDVEAASSGLFPSDVMAVYERWDDFRSWASTPAAAAGPAASGVLGPPVPRPRQLLAIGLNYRDHAAESGFDLPEHPVVFGKFASSLTGPGSAVHLPSDGVDWEVELVVVVGREAHNVPAERAWEYIAGLTIGQDLSWRSVQTRGPAPQFSIGKSYPGFSPIGPWVVTPDDLPDPDDLRISCALDGEVLQDGRTSDLVFPVAELVSRLSASLTLFPGDLIFTGTPAGVGIGRKPPRFLVPGSLVSTVEGIGDLTITLTR